VFISLTLAVQHAGGQNNTVCNAWPVRRQTYRYLGGISQFGSLPIIYPDPAPDLCNQLITWITHRKLTGRGLTSWLGLWGLRTTDCPMGNTTLLLTYRPGRVKGYVGLIC